MSEYVSAILNNGNKFIIKDNELRLSSIEYFDVVSQISDINADDLCVQCTKANYGNNILSLSTYISNYSAVIQGGGGGSGINPDVQAALDLKADLSALEELSNYIGDLTTLIHET